MKVKELLKALEGVDLETEVIGGAWNGRISTYTVLDNTIRVDYDVLKSNFFGTGIALDLSPIVIILRLCSIGRKQQKQTDK